MVIPSIITGFLTNSYMLINQWGYIGVFLISLVSSASLFFFPVPYQAVIFAAAAILNPFLVAVFATIGSTIGDSSAYLIGLGGKEILEKKFESQINKTRKKFERFGVFVWIFIASLLPLPIDIVSIICGVIKYDYKKYVIALTAGKFIKHLVVAYVGAELFALL